MRQGRDDQDAAPRPVPKVDLARRLAARVFDGEAELGGSYRQCLRVSSGEEGNFDISGQPQTAEVRPEASKPWWGIE